MTQSHQLLLLVRHKVSSPCEDDADEDDKDDDNDGDTADDGNDVGGYEPLRGGLCQTHQVSLAPSAILQTMRHIRVKVVLA